ncbi:uncharacterized protein LOC115671962 isoform X2 [Syzygium oleosum]|uniref:uncharacterized protein LOC115671962 isoform X2 n=1 Tax=Syzygium oleosum TaxID=219896 RepID=UPI0011D19F73|nr:uncharacterized protein LOC115671962 isoform X2 [Syzygium oleosum]XP_030449541.1 uncharacterized protein LOC115671962 isoform X2 [Syzygium oleosum]
MSISGVTAEVQYKSYPAGYYPMRDLNEDYYICNWPLYHQDKALSSKQWYNGFWSRPAADEFPGSDKDVVKQTIIEHEAVFKNQVYELHRLYRVQRGLKDEIKRKGLHVGQTAADTESSPLPFQLTSEDAQKWHFSSIPGASSCYGWPSISDTKGIPLDSPEGNSTQGSPFVHQHGGSSKLKEVLECRPSKVRRKMFDLQLPADQYIDDEELKQIENENGSSSCDIPCQGSKIVAGSSVSLSHGGYSGIYTDSARSDLHINSRNVADLNAPIQIEDMNASASFVHAGHFFSEREIRGEELFMKAKPKILGFLDQKAPNSLCQSSSGSSNAHVNNKNDGALSFHVLKQGQDKVDLQPVSQTLQWEKFRPSSQPVQSSFKKSCNSPAYLSTDQAMMVHSRERTKCGLVISESSKNSESIFASDSPNQHKITSLSDSRNFRRSGSSSDNLSNGLSQKSMLVEGLPSLDSYKTPRKDSQPAAQSHGSFGSRWHDSNASLSPGYQNLPTRNGFHYELSSRSEKASVCIPVISHDSHNHANRYVASEHLNTRKCTSSNIAIVDSEREIKRNSALSSGSFHKSTSPQGVAIKNGESTQQETVLVPHWLRVMPAREREKNSGIDSNHGEMSFVQSSSSHLSSKVEAGNGPSQTFSQCAESFSPLCKVESKRMEIGEGPDRKIFGFPIFANPPTSKNAFSPLASPSISITQESKCEVTDHKREVRTFDINLPCDPVSDWSEVAAEETLDLEKESSTKNAYLKHQFDLNSCVLDDETSMTPSVPSVVGKVNVEIDLEAPPVLETEEDSFQGEEIPGKLLETSIPFAHQETEQSLENLGRIAAEAIVAISTVGFSNCLDSTAQDLPEEASLDCLEWFAGIVASFEDHSSWTRSEAAPRDCEEQNVEESTSESIDYFESMTLRQVEMGEEEYLPKPLIHETPRAEDVAVTPASNRPRRGQARRGRQRRDFQRDILPGLASLSRHEVTEDLQTFGGLMRAMGYSWHTGSTRRNSSRNVSSRGRQRLASGSPTAALDATCSPMMHQKNTVEVGLEDRTPTVWGNTPRRPRRQRCPAGNPPLHVPPT